MADGKWIMGLSAATPLEEAARRVLGMRLQVVAEFLPDAIHKSAADVEHVHQLRVATRRARAALDIFAANLPLRVYKGAKKQLRRIRRAAGAARDWDVFLETLRSGSPRITSRQRPGIDLLVGLGLAQRVVAQRELDGLELQSNKDKLEGLLAETVAAVQPADDPSLGRLRDLAEPLLGGLVRELAEAATHDFNDYQHLHQVRILGKRLRYAMEVFADCFPNRFRHDAYPLVEEMQEILGLANDSHVALGRLDAILAELVRLPASQHRRFAPGMQALREFHEKRLPRQVKLFRAWWKRWQNEGASVILDVLAETCSHS